MEVCAVCGAFLIVGDAQQRIDDHLMGKQHVGLVNHSCLHIVFLTSFNMLTNCMQELSGVGLGVKINILKVCCLWYADDAAVISNSMEDLQSLVSRIERFNDEC